MFLDEKVGEEVNWYMRDKAAKLSHIRVITFFTAEATVTFRTRTMLVREVECASVLTDKRTCQILGPDDGHFTFHFATASCLQVPVLYAARAVSISTDVVVTHHFPISIAHSKHQCHCCCNTDNACYSSVHDRLNSTCAPQCWRKRY